MSDPHDPKRREFLKVAGAAAVAGAAVSRGEASAADQQAFTFDFSAPPIPLVRIGYVGIGGQGSSHVLHDHGAPAIRLQIVDGRDQRAGAQIAAGPLQPQAGVPAAAGERIKRPSALDVFDEVRQIAAWQFDGMQRASELRQDFAHARVVGARVGIRLRIHHRRHVADAPGILPPLRVPGERHRVGDGQVQAV